jgi:AraC family transcriptional regulator
VTGDPLAAAGLLPAVHAADRVLRRASLRLVRTARTGDGAQAFAAASVFALLLSDLQVELRTLIERCAGRTHAQRRNVFLRLQRVRNYMSACCHLDLDIAHFARMASYSPCHFIRAFSAVYGETPHALLIEQRLGRARRLVNDSAMAITEVARASGFENRCAFSRSFKRRFGVSATDLRLGAAGMSTAAA